MENEGRSESVVEKTGECGEEKNLKEGKEELPKTVNEKPVETDDTETPMETDDIEIPKDEKVGETGSKAKDSEADVTEMLAEEQKVDQKVNQKVDQEVDRKVDAHIYSEDWSKLSKEDLIDHIKGMVYGQAIGDALGLATEFMSKKQAKEVYKKQPLSYADIIQDFHRSRWDKGDWTDDTDQMLLIMLMIIDRKGGVDQVDFAGRLYKWMCEGFKEFGDYGGMGIGATVSRTLRKPNFCQDPVKAAKDVWEESGRYLAANGAVMRTSILGALCFNDLSAVVSNTVAMAEVTHADPRCKASCVAITVAIALMLQGNYNLSKEKDFKALIDKATEEARKQIELKPQIKEMEAHIKSNLKGLKLDDRNAIGYTFKTMGCGFHGLRGTNFRDTITEVIMEAGDADTNASVCGAVLGCKIGFKNLPKDLLDLKHKDWLEAKVNAFLKVTGLLE